MAERILPPDAETIVVAYLSACLPGAPVVGFRQGDPNGRALQVRQTGGSRRDVATFVPQVTITAWGANPRDELGASDLALEAASWMAYAEQAGWMGGAACAAVEVLSLPYQDPDPATGRARYSATYRPHLRGAVV